MHFFNHILSYNSDKFFQEYKAARESLKKKKKWRSIESGAMNLLSAYSVQVLCSVVKGSVTKMTKVFDLF